jgi:hypothetical protein
MRPAAVCACLLLAAPPAQAKGQVVVELSYGADRNIDGGEAEMDGWLNGTVERRFPSGLGVGLGTDHQFEGAGISASGHLGWSIYLSSSFELPGPVVAPFARGGIGLGRAPCEGDTCASGLHLRISGGVRIRLSHRSRLLGEIGVSRVSRPFGGAGLALAF